MTEVYDAKVTFNFPCPYDSFEPHYRDSSKLTVSLGIIPIFVFNMPLHAFSRKLYLCLHNREPFRAGVATTVFQSCKLIEHSKIPKRVESHQ